MQEAFGIVMWVVVAVGVVVAVITWAGVGGVYDQIGRGLFALRDEREALPGPPPPGGALAAAEREDEIRQLLEARNARRVRRGLEELDVDAELARLTAAPPADADPALVAEIRELVIARNERRVRKGQEPLDVAEEVARQLRELSA